MIKKIWNDPVFSAVISAIIIAIITFACTTISAKVNNVSFAVAWNDFWTLKIELWIIVLVSIVLLLLSVVIKKKKRMFFLSYTKGTWNKNIWQWIWEYDSKTKKYHIFNLYMLCPKCQKGNFTVEGLYSREYKCIQCGFSTPMHSFSKPSSNQISREIYKYVSENFNSEMKYIDLKDS